MARPELIDHPKFLKLKRLLNEQTPHVLGYLELLWLRARKKGTPLVGTPLDVESTAEYGGESGKFTAAMFDSGLLDLVEGQYIIHDLEDHTPKFKKIKIERRTVTKTTETITIVDQSPIVLEYPCKKEETWKLTEDKSREYAESFPTVDLMTEFRKARQWCIDNPARRKTFKRMPQFISGWLGRAQQRVSQNGSGFSRGAAQDEYAMGVLFNEMEASDDDGEVTL